MRSGATTAPASGGRAESWIGGTTRAKGSEARPGLRRRRREGPRLRRCLACDRGGRTSGVAARRDVAGRGGGGGVRGGCLARLAREPDCFGLSQRHRARVAV